jgi:FkbM family methyltransferase
VTAVGRLWRRGAYLLLTYVGEQRLRALRQHRVSRWIPSLLQTLAGRGTIRVGGSPPAFGLLLSTDRFAAEHVQAYGLVRGVVEPAVQEALRRHVERGATVFDLGANVGFFSILSARLVGPEGRVEAFEPVPASAAAVRAHAALNGLSNVHVHEAAVSDRRGSTRLWLARERSQAHLADRGVRQDADQAITVPLIALDDEIEAGRLPVPSVLKIDVEGSEIAVLEGLRRTLATHDLVVICELHETNAEVLELVTESGYQVENLEGPTPVAEAGPVHVLIRRS